MGTTFIYAVLIFCLLIFVHEFGHFIAAKSVGIRVNQFALGMGPVILRFGKGETEYSLRLFPIGGFVKMEGEDEESDDPRSFGYKNFWQKGLVVVAGSVMNVLTTILIITLMALIAGLASTVIDEVSPGFPAEAAGLLPGDRIVQIDQTQVREWDEVLSTIGSGTGDTIKITVERAGETLVLTSRVAKAEDGRRIIGITSRGEHNVFRSLLAGLDNTWRWTVEMLSYLGLLFTGKGSMEDLVGPVGIVSMISDQAKLGLLYIANLTALISLNLAIVNMLPFPALDGGRILFLLIRQVTGKAISDEVEGKIHFGGILLLFALMIYLVIQDVGRFFV